MLWCSVPCFGPADIQISPLESETTQGWYNPNLPEVIPEDHQQYFQYNIVDIPEPFVQEAGTIYWLELCMDVTDGEWGWKTSDDHWNDDAVWRFGADWNELLDPQAGSPHVDPFFVNSAILIPPGPVDGWYYYENTGWWNTWFYDDPLDPNKKKIIHISFDLAAPSPDFQLAVNWSTDQWPTDSGPPLPPLTVEEEEMYIGRHILEPETGIWETGHYEFDYEVHEYNPEWVSIDVRGAVFVIENGVIEHLCVESLDLAFVITPPHPIPAVSEWGLVVMALLALGAGTIVFRRLRAAAA